MAENVYDSVALDARIARAKADITEHLADRWCVMQGKLMHDSEVASGYPGTPEAMWPIVGFNLTPAKTLRQWAAETALAATELEVLAEAISS